jgi:hypothetical protein
MPTKRARAAEQSVSASSLDRPREASAQVPSKHHAHRLARVPVVRKASGVFVIVTGGADLSI